MSSIPQPGLIAIYTDFGAASGIKPGDVLRLFEERENLPPIMIGQAMVLTVEPGVYFSPAILAALSVLGIPL